MNADRLDNSDHRPAAPPALQLAGWLFALGLLLNAGSAAAAEAVKSPPLLVPLRNSQFPEYEAERRVMGVARPEWVRYADPNHVPTYTLPPEWSRPPASAQAYGDAAARAPAPPPPAGGVGVVSPPSGGAMVPTGGVVSPGTAPMRTRAERDALIQQHRALNQSQGGGAPQSVAQGGPVETRVWGRAPVPAAPPVATPAPTLRSRLADAWRRFRGQ